MGPFLFKLPQPVMMASEAAGSRVHMERDLLLFAYVGGGEWCSLMYWCLWRSEASETLELELQWLAVSFLVWVLGMELGALGRTASTLKH